MLTNLLNGLAGRFSSVIPDTPTTHSGWRYADAIDAAQLPVSIGDYIIDGPNIVQDTPNGQLIAVDVRTIFNNKFALGPGKHLHIIALPYNYVYLENDLIDGESWDTLCRISQYGGQLINGGKASSTDSQNTFAIVGAKYFRLTGEYSEANKTGHQDYPGHEGGYGYSAGRYGMKMSMGWRNMEFYNFAVGGNTTVGMANNFEIDHIEVTDGGFGISLKWDSPPLNFNTPMTYKFHDNYVHDVGGEGGYFGQNTNNGSHKFINCLVYNNRFSRVSNEGLQVGNYAQGCKIYNNTFVHCAIRWKSPFQPYQHYGLQIATRQGEVIIENNIIIGVGEYFISASNANGVNTPADTPQVGQDIIYRNNLFFGTRSQGVYISPANDGITGMKFINNWFAYFMRSTAPADLKFDSVYPGWTPATFVVATDNATTPILFEGNKYQKGLNLLRNQPANVTITGNTEVENPIFPQFVDAGFTWELWGADLTMWSAKIGESAGFPFTNPTTRKGEPNYYQAGQHCMYKGKLYRSKQNNNAGHEPQVASNEWWELVLFNNGTTPTPPDDHRLLPSDEYNFLGIGLLDNIPAESPAIPIDLYSLDLVSLEPEVFDPTEIHIAVQDNGDNRLRFKIDYPTTILTANTRIIAIGSSTLEGTGADPGFKLWERLKAWTTANVTGGYFERIAVGGRYSNHFMPDNETALADWNKNINAALALNPDIVIVSLPSNDPGNGNSVAQFLANLTRIAEVCTQRNVYCFITTTQPRTGYDRDQQQMLYDSMLEIKAKFKKFAVDVFTPLAVPYTTELPAVIKPELNKDSIHVNNTGHGLIFDAIIAAMQAAFPNKGYTKYQIQRANSINGPWSLLVDNITTNVALVPREDNGEYFYRVIARRGDGTFTAPSNTVSAQQEGYAGEVVETVLIDAGRSTNPVTDAGWNSLMPTDDNPNAGEIWYNLLNTDGFNSGISLEIGGDFNGSSAGGGSGGVFPQAVIRSAWRASAENKPYLILRGADPNSLYNIKLLASFSSLSPNPWYTGVSVGDRDAYVSANDPVLSANQGTTADILGVQPNPDGTIEIKVRALPTAFIGWFNALRLERLNTSGGIPISLYSLPLQTLEPIVIGGSTTNGTVLLNFTGAIDDGLVEWINVNLLAGEELVDLLTEDFNNSGLGVIPVNSNGPGRIDNSALYLVYSPEWPFPVMRYAYYRSGNPAFQIKFTNLSPFLQYDFEIMCSVRDVDNVQNLTMNGETKSINVSNNLTPVVFLDVLADVNGEAILLIQWVSGPSVGVTYINAAKVTLKPYNASTPILLDLYDLFITSLEPEVLQSNIIIDLYDLPITSLEPAVFQDNSAPQLTNTTVYVSAQRTWIGLGAGYSNNTNLYPLVVNLAGSGPVDSGSAIGDIILEGMMKFWNLGDRWLEEVVVAAPWDRNISSWGNLVDGRPRYLWLIDYMVANYRINTNQILVTGLSLGGAGAVLAARDYPNMIVAIVPVAGSQATNFNFVPIKDIAIYSHHGTTDRTQDTNNSVRILAGMNALVPPPKYNPMISLYWGQGHGAGVWDNNAYRRKSSPIAGTKALWNINLWMLKWSKNQLEEAIGHVRYAEDTLTLEDYLMGLAKVNALPASTDKSALLVRLGVIKSGMFTRMWVVKLGAAAFPLPAPYNSITTINNGQSVLNMVDFAGVASVLGFMIVNRFSTWLPERTFSVRLQGKYFGLHENFLRTAASVRPDVTNGSCKFINLNDAKRYILIVIHTYEAPNPDDVSGGQSNIAITVNGVTITQYAQFNTFQTIIYNNLAPVATEIVIGVRAPLREAAVAGFILLEKP